MQTNLFELNPDLRSLIENIQLGPQAEVLELIDNFNTRYIQGDNHIVRSYNLHAPTKPLGITKKFYWKPGAYDTIKDILWHQGEMHKKAASLSKVVTRVRDNANWRLRGIKNELQSIEDILTNFRQQGLIMQDNTDDVVESWETIKAHLYNQYEMCDGVFGLRISPVESDGVITNYLLDVIYNYSDVKINYRHFENPDSIAEVNLPGQGYIVIRMSLVKLINTLLSAKLDINNLSGNNIRVANNHTGNKNWFYAIGGRWYGSYEGLQHPFISCNSYSYNYNNLFNDAFRYVCVGGMGQEFQSCVKALDFISLKVFIDRLMTHYDTQTGPLNQINRSYFGQPNFLEGNDEYYNINAKMTPSNCGYGHIVQDCAEDGIDITEDSYCAEYCTVKNECPSYKAAVVIYKDEPVEVSPTTTNAEREALEALTLNLVNNRRNQ